MTGAGGFVGAHLANRLVAAGWEVVGTVRPGTPHRPLPGVRVVAADLADPDVVAGVARGADPDVAFLLAAARAESTAAERARTAAVNADSGLWLVDALPRRCRAVVRLGSSTEYGESDGPMDESAPLRPRGFFGATKASGSLLVSAAAAARNVPAAVLRAFQVYGPGDHAKRFVPRVLRAARTGEVLPLTGPGLHRDWVYVDDVVAACLRAAEACYGGVLNVGTGVQTANEELVAAAERVTGRRITVAVGAHPGCPWDARSWVSEPSRAREVLGWEAKVTLEEGLARCWTSSS
ncbi:MAG: NAD-dependent epimerase/dehydratase family protein [Acidimicrobiia bacterium]